MVKKCLNDTVLFTHKNTLDIHKQCVQANSDGSNVVKKYQAHFKRKT